MKPEAALHRQTAAYLRAVLREPTIWNTFPAGGGGRIRGAQLKAAGLQRGWPDLIVMHPDRQEMTGAPIVLGIELKSRKGRQSAEQQVMAIRFAEVGALYAVCRSIEDVDRALRDAGIPVHGQIARAA